MNLHGVVSGAIRAVNPMLELVVRISTGYTTDAAKKRTPSYATPGTITASLADDVMTVTAVASGKLLVGQQISGVDVIDGTEILADLGGNGGAGDYRISPPQTLASTPMTTDQSATGQVQPLTFKDLTQLSSLNIQGAQRAIYINGQLNGLVRETSKGGDLIQLPDGTWWLVNHVLEQWPDWVKVAVTQQVTGA